MAAKRTTKSDVELKREFAVERFFWTFCGQFVRARDAGLLETFWDDMKNAKARFDHDKPTSRRIQVIAPPPTNVRSAARPPTKTPHVTQPPSASPRTPDTVSKKVEPRFPRVQDNQAARRVPSTARPTASTQGFFTPSKKNEAPIFDPPNLKWLPAKPARPLPLPVPKKKPMPSEQAPAPSLPRNPSPVALKTHIPLPLPATKPRPRSPSPVAGPSQSRAPPPALKPSRSSTASSSLTSYVEGRRIPWSPEKVPQPPTPLSPDELPVPEDINNDDDSDEYEPSINVMPDDSVMPEDSIKVKHVDKGKEKMKERVRKDDKRVRTQPVKSQELREKACARCVKIEADCYAQVVGLACFPCAKMKLRCDVDDKAGRNRAEKKEKKPRVTKTRGKKSGPRRSHAADDSSSAKFTPAKRGRKLAPRKKEDNDNASTTDEDSSDRKPDLKRRARSPPPQEPSAKRRAEKKQRGDALSDDREEIRRLRDIVDAILPVHIRLTDDMAKMKDKLDRMAGCILDLEDAMNVHTKSEEIQIKNALHRIVGVSDELDRMKERMDSFNEHQEDESDESDDVSVQIIEQAISVAKEVARQPATSMTREEDTGSAQPLEGEDRVGQPAIVMEGEEEQAVEDEWLTSKASPETVKGEEYPSLEDQWPADDASVIVRPVIPELEEGTPVEVEEGEVVEVKEVDPVGIEGEMTSSGRAPTPAPLPTEMPPPPPPASRPPNSPSPPPPPPPTPAVTLQPPTPITSQEGHGDPTTSLTVPEDNEEDLGNRPDPVSSEPAASDVRRSERIRSRSPSPLPPRKKMKK